MTKVRGFEILPEYLEKANEIAFNVNIPSYIPQRATSGSAGYDLRSIEHIEIPSGEVGIVKTGLTAYMQEDEELQIRIRSSLAKKKVTLANSPGTIDSDYYGKHIMLLVHNQRSTPFIIAEGDRIGQAIFSKYLITDDDNPVSNNRSGGFGSTGVN